MMTVTRFSCRPPAPLVGDIRAGGRTPAGIAVDAQDRPTGRIRALRLPVIAGELRGAELEDRVRVVGDDARAVRAATGTGR